MLALNNSNASTPVVDPWRDAQPVCRVYSQSPRFRQVLEDYVGEVIQFTTAQEKEPREALLVDCTESSDIVPTARVKFPTHAVVAVISASDTARVIDALANGADGVIAMSDPPSAWRECLHVVLGGGRWLGGPGLDVSLENKYASYDIAMHDSHAGDVTLRTKLFVKTRLADKPRG
jgi:DNA-binding NarL/FixJ family response regulator